MMTFTELAPAASDPPEPFTGRLRLAVAACLARLTGSAARGPPDPSGFALVAMLGLLGLLGLRIFEASPTRTPAGA